MNLFKGNKGVKGEKGEKGMKGMKGEKGIKGQKGDKGEKGIKGQKGLKGQTQLPPLYFGTAVDRVTCGNIFPFFRRYFCTSLDDVSI